MLTERIKGCFGGVDRPHAATHLRPQRRTDALYIAIRAQPQKATPAQTVFCSQLPHQDATNAILSPFFFCSAPKGGFFLKEAILCCELHYSMGVSILLWAVATNNK